MEQYDILKELNLRYPIEIHRVDEACIDRQLDWLRKWREKCSS